MRVSNALVGHRVAMDIMLKECRVLKAGTVVTYNILIDLYASKIEHVPVIWKDICAPDKYKVEIVFKSGQKIKSEKYNTLADAIHEAQQLIDYAHEAHQMRVAGIELFACKADGTVEIVPNPTAFVNIYFKRV